MKAIPIEMNWNADLPIFARPSFLSAVGDEYGWLGGVSESGQLRCILPYTIIRKAIFRIVRFRVETLFVDAPLNTSEEKVFLNSAIEHLRTLGADLIMPATTNTIFRTYPTGADAAPYGSYIIDLAPPEETLWKNIERITRQNIKTAAKSGVTVSDAMGQLDEAYLLIKETFGRSQLPFMSLAAFKRYVAGLGEFGKVLKAEYKGVPQSFVVFGYSNAGAYAIYAGNHESQQQGANKLLYWEAIRLFRSLGARQYDFVGARIRPRKGTKEESLASLKRRFGATLKEGYMWKQSISPLKYRLYGLAARMRSGGDIVDRERHKLHDEQNTESGD